MQQAVRGFTLVEVLIALVVLAMASVLMADTFGASARNVVSLKDTSEAWLLASNKLVELQVYQQFPQPGIQDDRVLRNDREWLVRTHIMAGPYPDTVRADIQAGQLDGKGEFISYWSITSLLGKPFAAVPRTTGGAGG